MAGDTAPAGSYQTPGPARVRNAVLTVSAAAWIVLLVEPRGMGMIAHGAGTAPSLASLPMLLAMTGPGPMAAGWALMLVAMMAPALIPPIRHIHLRSFLRRRARSIAIFLAGYAAMWMVIGGALLAAVLTLQMFAPRPYLPAAGVGLVALLWQISPIKQSCLNRCHAHAELAAFGAAADFDALRFGATHGIWCVGSCWALMLLPMLLPRASIAAMAVIAVFVISERLERPMPPSWRWRGLGKAMRIVIAQSQMRLHALGSIPALFSSNSQT
jgi:predicted metal-binding membrane protein